MKNTDFILISLTTLIAALSWVFFDAYHAYTTTRITPALEEIAISLTPSIDRDTILKLKSRSDVENLLGRVVIPPPVLASVSGQKR